ncbi:lipopolysaccharide biosynthesis protein [Mesorhizobium sp. M0913]|uniref:lipopolysaccharide biosynthesis protein n=1 Tax=Mesorhizobium sp. M0913 TaxID=2957026 RepID=UPI003335A322
MQNHPKGYRKTAVRGAAITGIAQLLKVGLQIASTVVLSRLLQPADFGIVAMVAPIVAFVSLFQDLGLQQAIVQARDVTPEQISRLFWINLAMSCSIAVSMMVVAPLAGWFYGDSRVVLLTALWSLPLLLVAVAAQHLALLNRTLQFSAIAAIDVVSSVSALLCAILSALILHNYWALWFSVAAGTLTTAAMAWYATGWRPQDPRVRADTGQMLRFGLNLAGFNFMNFFSRNLDNVVIGKAFGPSALGFYDRSYKLLLAPLGNINAPAGRVLLPILARMRDEPQRYRDAYLRSAGLITWICVPGIAALAIVADDFVPLLLGQRWAAAAPIFAWLGVAGVCQPLGNATGWLFTTQHRTNDMFRWGIFSSSTTIASFFAGLPWGVTGVAVAYALSSLLLRQPLLLFWVGRRGPVRTSDLVSIQLPVLVSSFVCFLFMRLLDAHSDVDPFVNVVLALAISYSLALAVLMAIPATRNSFISTIEVVMQGLKQRRSA